MRNYRLVVYTNCKEGTDAEFNDWYTNRHLPGVLAVPGFISAERMRAIPQGDVQPPYRYLFVQHFQSDDPEKTLTELSSRAKAGLIEMSELLQPDLMIHVYELIE